MWGVSKQALKKFTRVIPKRHFSISAPKYDAAPPIEQAAPLASNMNKIVALGELELRV